jgi:signal recognition particle GTPase
MTEATLNVHVNDYTNRVLGVIKEMFGLRNKSEALNKFVEMFGEQFINKEVREDVVEEIIASCNAHIKKHGMRRMSMAELKKVTGAE